MNGDKVHHETWTVKLSRENQLLCIFARKFLILSRTNLHNIIKATLGERKRDLLHVPCNQLIGDENINKASWDLFQDNTLDKI